MFHWQIILGLAGGLTGIFLGEAGGNAQWLLMAGFLGRVIGTCAVFYVLFLCRMLGAGDIKLMALCPGILGVQDGLVVIFLGLALAAVRAAWKLCSRGILWERMARLAEFTVRSGRAGRLLEYPGREEKESVMRLGPYLFCGYCAWLVINL